MTLTRLEKNGIVGSLALSIIANIVAVVGLAQSCSTAAMTKRIEANSLLDDAMDAMGGVEGTAILPIEIQPSGQQMELANRNIRDALAIAPDYAPAHRVRGNYLILQGQAREAIAAYRTAISLDSTHAMSHSDLGGALASIGDEIGARASLQKALDLDPNLAQAHANLAVIHEREGATSEAIEALRTAIRLDSSSALAHYNLAVMLERNAATATEAAAMFERAYQLMPRLRSAPTSKSKP